MLEFLWDVLLDSVIDTAKLLPFLFITYVAMEALEHSTSGKLHASVARAGKAGPVIGALLGAVPQCGFSAMAATLFSGGVVSLGTLVAVLLSTSDEMIPVFAAHPEGLSKIVPILAIKVLVGLLAGLFVDLAVHALWHTAPEHHIHDLCDHDHCGCDDELEAIGHSHSHDAELSQTLEACSCGHSHEHDHAYGHTHEHGHGNSSLRSIFRAALSHTVQVTVFVFAASLAIGLVVEGLGEELIGAFFANNPTLAVFLAGLLGLIPNCAASIIISELYLSGTLSAAAMLTGLLVAGGSGLLVLYRTNQNVRENLLVTVLIYLFGVGVGVLAAFAGFSL